VALEFKGDWFQGLKGKGKAASPLGSLDGTIDPDQCQVGLEATDPVVSRNNPSEASGRPYKAPVILGRYEGS
jgi:hypothetical protein